MNKSVDDIVKNWHQVESANDYFAISKIMAWALENCQSKFYNRGNKWFFHNKQDATIFMLKYGEKQYNS